MAQDQINISGGGDNGEGEPGDARNAGQVNVNTSGTDDLLDEIDALLDTNAEEFVRSYVQKGGQ
ncbi:ubiquitin-like protein Pup [Corynebacterium appendicis]|uniref:ubiquitin-like protein Pup n=1 Tax=Corynebacterium appendicis TaxID=163202 RepID=UPI00254FB2DF|nr:ubiquitin-like protein Pup [Corynebacterium appendicis]MDK8625010.1 ubiquitin-like protein Pup [Corynebacterium appendicis]